MARSHLPEPVGSVDPYDFARLAEVSPYTIRNWRNAHRGPQPIYLSARVIRYRLTDIEAFLDGRWDAETRTPTAASAASDTERQNATDA
jgi:hypothetical protein